MAIHAANLVRARLVEPVLASAPPNATSYVNLGTWFWTTAPWEPISITAMSPVGAGWMWVTATATPTALVYRGGDGDLSLYPNAEVACAGPGRVWIEEYGDDLDSPCMYTYVHSSRMAENGEYFPAELAIIWEITYVTSLGNSGALGTMETETPVAMAVKEVQAIIVPS